PSTSADPQEAFCRGVARRHAPRAFSGGTTLCPHPGTAGYRRHSMKISVARTDVTAFETPLLAVMVLEGANDLVGPAARLDERLGGQMSRLIQRGDFRGKLCETAMVYPPAGA